jgi:hypothetical protein
MRHWVLRSCRFAAEFSRDPAGTYYRVLEKRHYNPSSTTLVKGEDDFYINACESPGEAQAWIPTLLRDDFLNEGEVVIVEIDLAEAARLTGATFEVDDDPFVIDKGEVPDSVLITSDVREIPGGAVKVVEELDVDYERDVAPDLFGMGPGPGWDDDEDDEEEEYARLAWVGRNCKFAIGYERQHLLEFDDPSEFSGEPGEHPGLEEELEPYSPYYHDDWVTGFYHVTTNLPTVMQWGALRSRRQLGPDAGLGLGGGVIPERAAPDKISLTHNLNKAEAIYEGLKLVARIAGGQTSAGEVFWHVCGEIPYLEEGESDEVLSVLSWHVPDDVIKKGDHNDVVKTLDAADLGPEEQYGLLQQLDDAIAHDEPEDPEHVTERTGYTAPWETVKDVDSEKIAIISLQVRKGAPYEYVPEEMEMRLDPEDVRIMDVVKN